jgi:hypothetical protein
MKQGFFKTKSNTLNAFLKKMQNQYGLISKDTDWDNYNSDAESYERWQEMWPLSIGSGFSTKIEQDEETGDYHMNAQLSDEEIARLPQNDTPVFWFQYEGEREDPQDPESPLLPVPTYKVENRDEDGNPLGTFYDRTGCVMR